MKDLAIVGGGLRKVDFVEMGRAIASVTAADINELKRIKKPTPAVEAALAACLVALGFYADSKIPTWADVIKLLSSAPSSQIAAALRGFEPKGITPAMVRKLKPLAERSNPEKARCGAQCAGSIASWVQAVYAYGAHQEQLLSNYATLSPRLAAVPYSKLSRYQPWDSANGPKEIGFCWKTGISERDFSPVEIS